jgi:hypothetical protein
MRKQRRKNIKIEDECPKHALFEHE